MKKLTTISFGFALLAGIAVSGQAYAGESDLNLSYKESNPMETLAVQIYLEPASFTSSSEFQFTGLELDPVIKLVNEAYAVAAQEDKSDAKPVSEKGVKAPVI